jgi:hypothetical protein
MLIAVPVVKNTDLKVATSAKLASMQCLMDLWERHTILCASRIMELWAVNKQLAKSNEQLQVRIAALKTLASAISHSAASGRNICEDVLKLGKSLLSEKVSSLRLAAAEVVLAVAKISGATFALPLETLLQSMIKSIRDTDGESPRFTQQLSALIGEIMFVLATAAAPPQKEKSFNTSFNSSFGKKRMLVGMSGVTQFFAAAFAKDRCPPRLRCAIAGETAPRRGALPRTCVIFACLVCVCFLRVRLVCVVRVS